MSALMCSLLMHKAGQLDAAAHVERIIKSARTVGAAHTRRGLYGLDDSPFLARIRECLHIPSHDQADMAVSYQI